MPMCAWFNRIWRDRRGVSAVELGLTLPVILILMLIILEVGRVYYQSSMVERGVRAGATYLARHDVPVDPVLEAIAENLVKRGTTDSSQPYLVAGWNNAGASYLYTTKSYAFGAEAVDVVQIKATVPFDPLFPDLMRALDLLDAMTIEVYHEQSRLDD